MLLFDVIERKKRPNKHNTLVISDIFIFAYLTLICAYLTTTSKNRPALHVTTCVSTSTLFSLIWPGISEAGAKKAHGNDWSLHEKSVTTSRPFLSCNISNQKRQIPLNKTLTPKHNENENYWLHTVFQQISNYAKCSFSGISPLSRRPKPKIFRSTGSFPYGKSGKSTNFVDWI